MKNASNNPTDPDSSWAARVRWPVEGHAVAYSRNHSVAIGSQASFRETDALPDALELLLAAVGGDLLCGLAALLTRRGISVHAMEASLACRLNNPLLVLGVIGEEGHPGVESLSGTIYVSADAAPEQLESVWHAVLIHSPLVNTLSRCASVSLHLQLVA